MNIQRYSVQPHTISHIVTWIQTGHIAIPEIQRPFVWNAAKVRDFMDSLYSGYPVGYIIAWKNPSVRLKDGSQSGGKLVLIDGQQRVTAILAAMLGQTVVNKDYQSVRITIAYHPGEERFEVAGPVLRRDPAWFPEPISKLPEKDCDAGQLNETQEVFWMKFPSNQNPSLPLYPREEAFYHPPPLIPT